MSRKRTVFIGAIAIVALFGAALYSNPLRRSDTGVRRWLEKTTPMGSSLSDVETVAFERRWPVSRHEGRPRDGAPYGAYLQGELGRYWSVPFYTHVTVFWSFDTNNHLTDIQVWKTTDGL